MTIDPTPDYLPLAHPIAKQQVNGHGRASHTSRLALVPFVKIEVGRSGAYLVKGLIPREGLIVVWGPPKCGKSFWTFDLVMHIALGWTYRGRRVIQGPVVYVACEGGHGFKARVEAFRQYRLQQDYENSVPFYLVPARFSLIQEQGELIGEIEKTLEDALPLVVVIDTLNRSLDGSESSDQDMSAYIKAADAIHEAFGCAVLIVHYCGTDETRPRGHTSLTGAVEAQIAVRKNVDGICTAKLEFMKDGPERDEIAFGLEQIEVGMDEDGDQITSCVVIEAESSKQEKALTGYAKTAFEALNEIVLRRQDLPESNTRPHQSGTSINVPVEQWRNEFYSLCIDGRDIERDTLKKRFHRAAKKLETLGKVGFRDGEAWIIYSRGTSGT